MTSTAKKAGEKPFRLTDFDDRNIAAIQRVARNINEN